MELQNFNYDFFEEEIERRRKACLERLSKIRLAVLIWGTNPLTNSLIAKARNQLRTELEELGHYVRYSEELYDPNSNYSLVGQQLAQVDAFHVVFSIPDSFGSIAEAHDFFRVPQLSRKIIIYLNKKWTEGYAYKSLIELQSIVTSNIQLYDDEKIQEEVINNAKGEVCRIQEAILCLGGTNKIY